MLTRAISLLLLVLALVPALPAMVGGGGSGGGGGTGGGAIGGGGANGGGVQRYDPNDPNNRNADETPSSVEASAFDVVVDVDGKKHRGRVTFAHDKVTSDLFGTLAFTEKQGRNAKAPVSFDASAKDGKGNPVVFSGRVTGDEMTATLTMSGKDGKAQDMPVVGGRVGTEAAKKALATLEAEKKKTSAK